MSNQLPHRFRESTFRDYEPFINRLVEKAVISWPTCIKIDPSLFSNSHATFVGRLRDALVSYHNHNWPSMINRNTFERIFPETQVSERTDGTILFGEKGAIKRWNIEEKVPVMVDDAPAIVIDITQPDLFFILSHFRLLTPRIQFTGITDEKAAQLQSSYDIAIDKNPDGTYTLI